MLKRTQNSYQLVIRDWRICFAVVEGSETVMTVWRVDQKWLEGAGLVAQWLSSHTPLHTLHFSSPGVVGSDPRRRSTHHSLSHAAVASYVQNRGRWAQMLAQGQSSSKKQNKTKLKLLLERTLTRPYEYVHLSVYAFVKFCLQRKVGGANNIPNFPKEE